MQLYNKIMDTTIPKTNIRLFENLPAQQALYMKEGETKIHEYFNNGILQTTEKLNGSVTTKILSNEQLRILKKKYEDSSKSFEQALKDSEIVGQMREKHTVRDK